MLSAEVRMFGGRLHICLSCSQEVWIGLRQIFSYAENLPALQRHSLGLEGNLCRGRQTTLPESNLTEHLQLLQHTNLCAVFCLSFGLVFKRGIGWIVC